MESILRVHTAVGIALASLFVLMGRGAPAQELRLTLEGSGGALGPTPLVVDLEGMERPREGDYRLMPGDGGPALAATVYIEEGRPKLALVLDRLEADSARSFALVPWSCTDDERIRFVSTDAGPLEIVARGKPFTTLVQGEYKPYFFPLIGPTGEPFTRAYPMKDVAGEERDHPHQRSLWFTHGDVNGVDFWGADPLNPPSDRSGTIKETRREEQVAGAALAVLRTENAWLDGSGKVLLEDERLHRFWDLGSMRWIDVIVRLKATHGRVTFGDTKEGMFGLRVPSSMDVKRKAGGRIVNAEGLTDQAAWGKASPWVDYSGPVGGRRVGIAILNHPASFRHPTTWHVRDYGLFAANPFGYHDFGINQPGAATVAAGQSIEFVYRVVLHEGDAADAGIDAQYAGYAHPPRVRVTRP